MTFRILPEHHVVRSEVNPDMGFFIFHNEDGMLAFMSDNRATIRITNCREGTDVDFHATLTITPKLPA